MVIPGGYLVTSKSLMTKGYHRGVRAARDGTCEILAFWTEGVRTPAGGRGDSRARVARLLPAGVKCSTAAAAVIGCLVGFRAIDLGAPHTMVTSEKFQKKVKLRVFRPSVGRRVDVGTSGSSPWPRRRMYHSHCVCSTRIFNAGTSRVEVPGTA